LHNHLPLPDEVEAPAGARCPVSKTSVFAPSQYGQKRPSLLR
jgi:hypothetical protein